MYNISQAAADSLIQNPLKDSISVKLNSVKKSGYYFLNAYKYYPVNKESREQNFHFPISQLQEQNSDQFNFNKVLKASLSPWNKHYKPVMTETQAEAGMPPVCINRIPNQSINTFNSYLFIILIAGLALLANIRVNYGKYLAQLLESVYNFQLINKLFRDKNSIHSRMYNNLNLVFAIMMAIFTVQSLQLYHIRIAGFNEYYVLAIIPCLILILYLFKFIVNHIIGFIFLKQALFSEYLFNTFLTYKIMGIFIIIPTIGISFLPAHLKAYFFWLGIFIFFILYIMRLWRGAVIIMKKNVLIFYLILYLCTIEFLPLVMIYKFSQSYIMM